MKVGAAVALVVSFVVLAFAWRTPRWRTASGIALPGLTRLVDRRGVRAVLRLVPLLLYGFFSVLIVYGVVNQLSHNDVAHFFIACCIGAYGLHSLSFVTRTLLPTQAAQQSHGGALLNHIIMMPF